MTPERKKELLTEADAQVSGALAALKAVVGDDTSTDVRSRVSSEEQSLRDAYDAANKRKNLILEGIEA